VLLRSVANSSRSIANAATIVDTVSAGVTILAETEVILLAEADSTSTDSNIVLSSLDAVETGQTIKTLDAAQATEAEVVIEATETFNSAEALNASESLDTTEVVVDAVETRHARKTFHAIEAIEAHSGSVETTESTESIETAETLKVDSATLLVAVTTCLSLALGAVGAALLVVLIDYSLATVSVWLISVTMFVFGAIASRAPVGSVASAVVVAVALHVTTMAVVLVTVATVLLSAVALATVALSTIA
jgi:hypothetical protein